MYRHLKRPRHLRLVGLILVVSLSVILLATTLVGTMSSADTQAPSVTATTVPAVLSGTISYGFSYTVTGGCAGCRRSESLSVTMTVTGSAISGSLRNPYQTYNLDNPDVYHCAAASTSGSKCFWAPLRVETASVHYHFATQVVEPNGCHTYAAATGTYQTASTPLPLGLDVVFNPGSTGSPLVKQPGPVLGPSYDLSGLPPALSYRASGDINIQMSMTYTHRAAASACGVTLPGNVWDLGVEFVGRYHPGPVRCPARSPTKGLGLHDFPGISCSSRRGWKLRALWPTPRLP